MVVATRKVRTQNQKQRTPPKKTKEGGVPRVVTEGCDTAWQPKTKTMHKEVRA